jgi:hypothetical protein
MAEKPTDGLFKRLGRGFDRYVGGLLGEDLEGMSPEEKAAARRSVIGIIGRGMVDPSQGSEALGAVTQARAMQRAQAEVARRTAAAEAEMPRIAGRLFEGTAGTLESLPGISGEGGQLTASYRPRMLESLPGEGGEGGQLTARYRPRTLESLPGISGQGGPLTSRYRIDPQDAMARLYGTQEGRDVANLSPGLATLAEGMAKEKTGMQVVGGSIYDRATGQFITPPEAPKPRVPVREVDLTDRAILYYSDGTSETFLKGAAPRGAGGGGGGGGGGVGGDEGGFGKEDATTLRKEATPQLAEYQKFGDAWGRIQEAATNPSAANDIALIFAYMKILDPTSAVREGEFATAANAGGIPQRVWARYNNLMRGEKLNPEQRGDFLSSAYGLVKSQHRNAQRVVDRYARLASGYGVKPEAVAENPLSWAIMPRVSNQQEFDKLPPGSLFEDATSGKLKVKPR